MSKISGYIAVPTSEEGMQQAVKFGLDPTTGIHRYEKDGEPREYVTVTYNAGTSKSNTVLKSVNVYPEDGKTFTEEQKKQFAPGKGFRMELQYKPQNKDVEVINGREQIPEIRLHQYDKSEPVIKESRLARRDVLIKKARKTHLAEDKKAKAEEKAQEQQEAAGNREWANGLESRYTNASMQIQGDPEVAYSKQFGMVVQKAIVVPVNKDGPVLDENGKLPIYTLQAPANQILQGGDIISVNDAAEYTPKKAEHPTLYALEDSQTSLKERTNKDRDPGKAPFKGRVTNAYHIGDEYFATIHTDEMTQVGNETMAKAATSVRVPVPEKVGKVLESHTKNGDKSIEMEGIGEVSYTTISSWRETDKPKKDKPGEFVKEQITVPKMNINVFDKDGKDNGTVVIDGKSPEEFVQPKEKAQTKAKTQTKAKAKTQKNTRKPTK